MDWLQRIFDGRINEIEFAVRQICPHIWQEPDDVVAEVLLRLHEVQLKDPGKYVNKQLVLACAQSMARYILLENRRKARVKSRDPDLLSQIAEPIGDDSDQEWKRYKTLLNDCDQLPVILADADERLREVSRLKCKGLSWEEIVVKMKVAGFTGVSRATLCRDLRGAFDILREKFASELQS